MGSQEAPIFSDERKDKSPMKGKVPCLIPTKIYVNSFTMKKP